MAHYESVVLRIIKQHTEKTGSAIFYRSDLVDGHINKIRAVSGGSIQHARETLSSTLCRLSASGYLQHGHRGVYRVLKFPPNFK